MDFCGLIQGNDLFKSSYYKAHEKEFLELAENGQHPKALFIGCSDSRVIPNLITKSDPGDLFVVRNVGNFVAPFSPSEDFHSTASAIEYAVSVLEVKNIIVCGHTKCGAIEAICEEHALNNPNLIHTKKWLTQGEIMLHGWIYDITNGEIEYYNPESMQFESLEVLKQSSFATKM